MDELIGKYEQLKQASRTLTEVLQAFQEQVQLGARRELTHEEKFLLFVLRDSVIQRFEYCYELLWKYCKLLLWDIHGIEA